MIVEATRGVASGWISRSISAWSRWHHGPDTACIVLTRGQERYGKIW